MASHLQRDLDSLQKRILGFAGLVENAIYKSVQSLQTSNRPLAEEVVAGDIKINDLENEVSEECLKMLALHQPVAGDLRRIATTFMITTDLERMGDLAKHIAQAALTLVNPSQAILDKQARMTDVVTSLVRQSLDAFVNLDTSLARKVVRMDDEVDQYNDELIDDTTAYMKQSSANIDAGLTLFTVTRHLERIADHATNIAEDVLYLVEGDFVKHRPEAIA